MDVLRVDIRAIGNVLLKQERNFVWRHRVGIDLIRK